MNVFWRISGTNVGNILSFYSRFYCARGGVVAIPKGVFKAAGGAPLKVEGEGRS